MTFINILLTFSCIFFKNKLSSFIFNSADLAGVPVSVHVSVNVCMDTLPQTDIHGGANQSRGIKVLSAGRRLVVVVHRHMKSDTDLGGE